MLRSLKNRIILLMLILSAGTFTGCASGGNETDDEIVQVYHVNNSGTAVISEDYDPEALLSDTDRILPELMAMLEKTPEHLEYEAPLSGNMKLKGYTFAAGLLTLNFGQEYNSQERIREILNRAAVVRTLTQAAEVESVAFQVEGQPLTGADGSVIGNMTADMFIYNAGNEINAYEKVELALYFANDDGDGLVEVYRNVVYNSNISLQRIAVEQLIEGPKIDVAFPVINPQTRINSIAVRDGVCYVDFDAAFLTEPYQVKPEVVIYSIVNSLVELSGVNKVQISVDGNTSAQFMETINLGSVFERNLDLVD